MHCCYSTLLTFVMFCKLLFSLLEREREDSLYALETTPTYQ